MLMLSALPLAADEGALTADTIDQMRRSFKMDGHTKAMYNSITNNDVSSLALNRRILQQHNEVFSHKIETKGVTDQKKSGRCWLFAGLNMMRQAIIKKCKLKDFQFSQNHLAFWDKLERPTVCSNGLLSCETVTSWTAK